jgi:hypothetical protein
MFQIHLTGCVVALCRSQLVQAVSLPLGHSLSEVSCVVASWPQPVWCRPCRCLLAAAGLVQLCRCLLAAAGWSRLCRCLLAAASLVQLCRRLLTAAVLDGVGCVVAYWPQPLEAGCVVALWPQPVCSGCVFASGHSYLRQVVSLPVGRSLLGQTVTLPHCAACLRGYCRHL